MSSSSSIQALSTQAQITNDILSCEQLDLPRLLDALGVKLRCAHFPHPDLLGQVQSTPKGLTLVIRMEPQAQVRQWILARLIAVVLLQQEFILGCLELRWTPRLGYHTNLGGELDEEANAYALGLLCSPARVRAVWMRCAPSVPALAQTLGVPVSYAEQRLRLTLNIHSD